MTLTEPCCNCAKAALLTSSILTWKALQRCAFHCLACAADTHGAFVQPALYEAFGLTVIEAMTCGLPVFATTRGGPAEIIVHGESGFGIDPYHGNQAAELMADFFEGVVTDTSVWERTSNAALERIRSKCACMQALAVSAYGQ